MANLHAALDRAVWAAYGWDDADPAAVEDDAILGRVLALNLQRSGAAAPHRARGVDGGGDGGEVETEG